jgi:hypothetical protein
MSMATASTLSRSFPTLRYVVAPFSWVLWTGRRRWTAALVLLATTATPVLWWSMQLLGLPDIGDRIIPGESRLTDVPDDRNATHLYRQAQERYRSAGLPLGITLDVSVPWSKVPQGLRREAEENREALALYREAADRPDASPGLDRLRFGVSMLHWLALLEASRLEEQGDMAGAWTWYRAVLRTIHHEGAFATDSGRVIAQIHHDRLRVRVKAWAADPRTSPEMIRRALADAFACRSIPPPCDSYTLVAECLQPDASNGQATAAKWNQIFAVPDAWVTPDQMQAVYDVWRTWHREPERSRRIIRLAIANWLAYERLPADRRPAPDLNVTGPYEFYAFGPEAPAEARALSPVQLDRWLASSPEARQFLDRWQVNRRFLTQGQPFEELRGRERRNDRALVVLLASELYRRDHHGTAPPSDEALVGLYLTGLPEEGSGDAIDADSPAPAARGSAGQEGRR